VRSSACRSSTAATSETLRAHGVEVTLEAAEHTMDGVIAALRAAVG
jgi:hypothetical protein